MKGEIGGYFGLEVAQRCALHTNAIALNSGRNCLEYIIQNKNFSKIYLPYYTCDVLLEPIRKHNLEFAFYHIDTCLNPIIENTIKENELLLAINYFSVKAESLNALSKKTNNLIIDNSQAFFSSPGNCLATFYSARKFFGVPDGAYLYTGVKSDMLYEQDRSFGRFGHLLIRHDLGAKAGYEDFTQNEISFSGQPVKRMSNLTHSILNGIDYINIRNIRKRNFDFLHDAFNKINELEVDFMSCEGPFVYPLLISSSDLRENLIAKNIFVAMYWENVLQWCEKTDFEYYLAKNLIPLPIDQRYSLDDMKILIDAINSNI